LICSSGKHGCNAENPTAQCRPTNTNVNVNGPKPYDHVMFNATWTNEVDQSYNMQVVNLLDQLRDDWHSTEPYPGAPYNHNTFRAAYSDHHPVVFQLSIPSQDDDIAEFRSTADLQPISTTSDR
jgi:hypothetical protein